YSDANEKCKTGLINRYFITRSEVESSMRSSAEMLGLKIVTLADIRQRFSSSAASEQYVCGQEACNLLVNRIGVANVYIPPDCAMIDANSISEVAFGDERVPVFDKINSYVEDAESKILFILGDYGTGKTALAGRLALESCRPTSKHICVYVSL